MNNADLAVVRTVSQSCAAMKPSQSHQARSIKLLRSIKGFSKKSRASQKSLKFFVGDNHNVAGSDGETGDITGMMHQLQIPLWIDDTLFL